MRRSMLNLLPWQMDNRDNMGSRNNKDNRNNRTLDQITFK
jgi:hypothetical protein